MKLTSLGSCFSLSSHTSYTKFLWGTKEVFFKNSLSDHEKMSQNWDFCSIWTDSVTKLTTHTHKRNVLDDGIFHVIFEMLIVKSLLYKSDLGLSYSDKLVSWSWGYWLWVHFNKHFHFSHLQTYQQLQIYWTKQRAQDCTFFSV